MEAFKLGLIVVIIIFALRRKVSIGLTLLSMGPITALIYQVPLAALLDGYFEVLISDRFISLTGLVILVPIMGKLLEELGYLDRLASACRGLYGGAKTATALLPPLIGVLPMPGGSLLSAPLVNSVLDDPKYSPEFKCATNYWFRHLIELTWPIYPGIVLTEAITGMPIATVSLLQSPLTLAMVLIGVIVFIRRIDNLRLVKPALWRPLGGILGSIWPVLIAVLLYGLAKLELSLSLVIAIVLLALVGRPSKKIALASLKEGLSVQLLMFVFGVLTFQRVLELSGGIESIPKLASAYNLPEELLIASVCFTIGLMTGLIAAYVGLGFTLLAGLLYQPELNPGYIMLASLSGLTGFLLSPAHLCMPLTNAYFGSDMFKMQKMLLLPLAMLVTFGVAIYLLGWGELFR